MAEFQCEFGCAKAEALVLDQTACARPEFFYLDDFKLGIPELRYSWRQPILDPRQGIDIGGIRGLLRNHDLSIGLLVRELRSVRARLDLMLDLVCAAYGRETAPLMAGPLAALVVAAHDERDRQADRRALEAAEQTRLAEER